MKALHPQQTSSQYADSAGSTNRGKTTFGEKPLAAFDPSLRPPFVTPSTPPMLEETDEEAHATIQTPASNRFRHHFGHISLFPENRAVLQTKLAVDASNNAYEREAERVAERVMGIPALPTTWRNG